jgi:Holliday junction resolvase RusA-like endonuclease
MSEASPALLEARSFVCVGPPRPKARPRVTPFGTFTPARTKQYERALRGLALVTFGPSWDRGGQYRVTAVFCSTRPLRGDVDNYAKSVLDGLEGAAFLNDIQVVEVRARKAVEPGRGARTEVLVERVGDAPAPERKRRAKRGRS